MKTPESASDQRSGMLRIAVGELLARLRRAVAALYDPREGRSIALLVAAELTGLPTHRLLTDPQAPCCADGERLRRAERELAAGRPVQYVVGHTEFCCRRFRVTEGVLVPRPETEELVDWVRRDERTARRLLDIGTGSGCIAATLAAELPGAEICAAEISDEALAVAAQNFAALQVAVDLRRADALDGLEKAFDGPFDAIVSNPPYVPASDRAAMHPNVRDHEPALALFVPDDDPLKFYRAIARAGRRMLRPHGKLYFEIYERAARDLVRMLDAEGYGPTVVREDLFGKPRMACSSLK